MVRENHILEEIHTNYTYCRLKKPCKRRRTTSDALDAEILHQLTEMKGGTHEDDEDYLFGNSIAAEMAPRQCGKFQTL